MIIAAAPAAVNPAPADVLHLGFRTELDFIEADARDLADPTTDADREALEDAYWAAMDEATLERMAGESHFADAIDSGLMPW